MRLLDRIIDKRIAEYQSDLLATHYAEVENMYRQARGWRHDYRNHIQVLNSYAEMGDLESLKEYLKELRLDLESVDTVLKTGNKMTDVILNSKISLAKARNISVRADAHVPVSLTTSEIDLCIIIGNLFDNAIEACMKLPEEKRLIRIYYEEYPVVYIFNQLYSAEKTEKGRREISQYQRQRSWLRAGADRHYCGALPGIYQQKQRGRRIYYRNPAAPVTGTFSVRFHIIYQAKHE